MLSLLLVDAELERVPPKLTGHQQVIQSARRSGVNPSKMLLDSSQHYAAMRTLPQGERRGRPDLVHFFLLTVLESIPNKLDQVRVFVHTRNDEVLHFAPHTRLIRNYNRFCGLMQQLFERGSVGEPDPLIRIEPGKPLEALLKGLAPDRVLVLHPEGEARAPSSIFDASDAKGHTAAIIGGFPSGDYRSTLPQAAEKVSIHPEPLTVWTVAAELLAHYPRSGSPLTR